MSAAPLPSAIEPARNGMIVLLQNTGSAIVPVDIPVIAWVTDPTGAPSLPVIPWTLTAPWARVEVDTTHLTPGLIGAPYISVVLGDESYRGSFPGLLDHLVTTTGLPVSGTELQDGDLVSAYWGWVSGRHGGRVFSAVAG